MATTALEVWLVLSILSNQYGIVSGHRHDMAGRVKPEKKTCDNDDGELHLT
jgi:hypothetical protein